MPTICLRLVQGMTVNQLKDHADDMVANTNLPEAKRDELQSLLGTLHQEEHQVACADAAVSAVAKVRHTPSIAML